MPDSAPNAKKNSGLLLGYPTIQNRNVTSYTTTIAVSETPERCKWSFFIDTVKIGRMRSGLGKSEEYGVCIVPLL